jgi:type VI secretion system protein ImpH
VFAPEPSVEGRLFEEGYAFDFFQAVRLLGRLDAGRTPVGHGGPPGGEVVRFRAHLSLSFPPSAVHELTRPSPGRPVPAMTVTFLGLTGPSGVLPRHYTELLLRLEKESRGPEKHAPRDWLDLFNHRLVSLFYRAWEKYRFYLAYERGLPDRAEPDPFTRCLFSLVGLGTGGLRKRLRVASREDGREQTLAAVEDLALLHYAGLLAQRHRNAAGLEALLRDYFGLPVRVSQFQGQWLVLEPANQSRLGAGNAELGVNVVAGERVWDVEGKVRVRLGPLGYGQFLRFLPDRAPVPDNKAFFLLVHLVRFYVGPQFDFDVQLVLRAEDVPECQLAEGGPAEPRLGWNAWLCSQQPDRPAEEAVFPGEEVVWVGEGPDGPRPPGFPTL